MEKDSTLTLDELSSSAAEKIGPLRSRVIRRASGALPYDYIVPNGVYEELNENKIKPYSNWQGPVWPHANWMVMHALIRYGYPDSAVAVAKRVTRLCLDDLAANGMMHENYHAETGAPLAAPNFISWNLLVAQMIEEARTRVFQPDPTQALWSEWRNRLCSGGPGAFFVDFSQLVDPGFGEKHAVADLRP